MNKEIDNRKTEGVAPISSSEIVIPLAELKSDMDAAWHYWDELAQDLNTPREDIEAAGRDYYHKQEKYDAARKRHNVQAERPAKTP